MNILESGLAFVEGIALIASPCILPVLPLILSASADGGKRRPFGIIAGFVISFSLFALLSRNLVEALHIDVNIIRTASLWLLFAFGLILISHKLSGIFSRMTQGAANAANRVQQDGKDGFFSGMIIGTLIGLIWTPCAGPILATVLVQVIRQQTDFAAIMVIISFAIGAGLPMLAVALLGRSLLTKVTFLTQHTEQLRRAFGVIIILAVGYIAFGTDIAAQFTMPTAREASAPGNPVTKIEDGLKSPYPAPPFVGLENWVNTDPLTIEDLKGKVVLVDFWTYSCINCVRTLPYLTTWDERYRNQGLVIVGVHSPEFEFEKNIDNVKAAIAARGIKYPVAQDNDFKTWQSFSNKYWPAHYLIDREGRVVYIHYGEGKYDITENNIRFLLGLRDKTSVDVPAAPRADTDQTPETYLGYGRAQHYSGTPELQEDITADYEAPRLLSLHQWALQGSWRAEKERTVAVDDNASLALNFKARKVFLVMGSADGKPIPVTLKLDSVAPGARAGKDVEPDGTFQVSQQTLYELVNQPEAVKTHLEIVAKQPGLEVYAFTFGG